MPVIFVLFNFGDCLGRLAAGLSRAAPASSLLTLYCLLRGTLVPAVLLCHLATPHPWRLPLVFRSAAPEP